MANYRAYVVPDANVNGEKKTLVLQSRLGLSIAAGLTPDLWEAFQVESSSDLFNDGKSFYKTLSWLVEKRNTSDIREIMKNLSEVRGFDVTRMIPVD